MRAVRVDEVMARFPATVVLGTTAGDAAALVTAAEIGQLMVLDADDRFVGVLSEGDLLRALLPDAPELAAAGGTVAAGFGLFLAKAEAAIHRSIDDLVVRDPVTIGPDAPVAAAAVVMTDRELRRLPVVADGRLVGTVSRIDVCRAVLASRRKVATTPPAPSRPGLPAPPSTIVPGIPVRGEVAPMPPTTPTIPTDAAGHLAAARERIAAIQRQRLGAPGSNGTSGG